MNHHDASTPSSHDTAPSHDSAPPNDTAPPGDTASSHDTAPSNDTAGRTRRSRPRLAAVVLAGAAVLGLPSAAAAQPAPVGPVDSIPVSCPSWAAPPVADLGDLPTAVSTFDVVDVVLDRSTGRIVHQRLQSFQGTTLWSEHEWDGPPGPDVRMGYGFASPSVRTLVLTVTDCQGRVDTVSHDIQVWGRVVLGP